MEDTGAFGDESEIKYFEEAKRTVSVDNDEIPPKPVYLWLTGGSLLVFTALLIIVLAQTPIANLVSIIFLVASLITAVAGLIFLARAVDSRRRFIYDNLRVGLDAAQFAEEYSARVLVTHALLNLRSAGAYSEAAQVDAALRDRHWSPGDSNA